VVGRYPLFENLSDLLQLTPVQTAIVFAAVFVAGLVRGFAGFAQSALIMASVTAILPPIQLIPICYVLETAASIVMFRGGLQHANMKIVWGLAIGATIGLPIGLYAITSLDADQSRPLILCIIFLLATAQLVRVSPGFLKHRAFLFLSGLTAGIATGLAYLGGMVVALYVLATDTPANVKRASLVMYLFIGVFTTPLFQFGFGVLGSLALTRGLVLAPIAIAGVLLGSVLFRPSLEMHYKRFCLCLLILLASLGLLRSAF